MKLTRFVSLILLICLIPQLFFGCAGGGTNGTGILKVGGLVVNGDSATAIPDLNVTAIRTFNGSSEEVAMTQTDQNGEFSLAIAIDIAAQVSLLFDTGGPSANNSFNLKDLPAYATKVTILFEVTQDEEGQKETKATDVVVLETASPTPVPPNPTATVAVHPTAGLSSSSVSQNSNSSAASAENSSSAAPIESTPTPPQTAPDPTVTPTPVATEVPTATPTPDSCPVPPLPVGDMDCDGDRDSNDDDDFLQAIIDPSAYVSSHPGCNILNGDINQDGNTNNFDSQCYNYLRNGDPLPRGSCC